MAKFVTNLKSSVINKENKTEEEEAGYDNDFDNLGLSRLASYRNVLRFSAVNKKDPQVNCRRVFILNSGLYGFLRLPYTKHVLVRNIMSSLSTK